MGRKPVFGLASLFLAGVTLTGCDSTDWCCFGNSKTTCTGPVARPNPDWPTRPMTQTQPTTPAQPTNSGANRFGTPSAPSVVQPVVAPETSAAAPRDSFQGSPTGMPDVNPPTAPSVDRRPVSAPPVNDPSVIPPPAVPRTSTPGVRIVPPPLDPPAGPSSTPLPPLESSATPPVPEPPTADAVPAAPTPVKDGQTQSSSKYQTNGPSLEVLPPPPPPPRVPAMPGSGPSGN